MTNDGIDEKTLRSILKCCNNNDRKVKEVFRFTLLKLLTNDQNIKNKIDNAYRNRSRWDPNCIQNIALKSLQDLFFNMIDHFSIKKPFDVSRDYIDVKYLEHVMNSYFEDKKDLENEIEELEEKLEGSGMIPRNQHNKRVKELEIDIEDRDNRIKKLEKQLKEREEYYKTKIACADKRAEERFKFLNPIQKPTASVGAEESEESEEQIEGDDI
jgi:hypothetical protein